MGRRGRELVEQKYDSRLRYAALQGIFEKVIQKSQTN
jgi:hypothetical protein